MPGSRWSSSRSAGNRRSPSTRATRSGAFLDPLADKLLATALGGEPATVNSFHHQALGELGDGLRATAVAPDGVVEAIELDGAPVLGVQWELQEECRIDARFARVFGWFVDAAVHARAGSPVLRPPAVRLS